MSDKKTTPSNMQRLAELIALAIQHNQNPAQKVNWFINFHGHVNLLKIRYYVDGLNDDNYESAVKFSEYIDNDLAIKMAIQFIEKRLTRLT